MKLQHLILALITPAILIGCGGGGSSTPTTTPPVQQSSSSSSEPAPTAAEKSSLLVMANLPDGLVRAEYMDVQLVGQNTVSAEADAQYLSMPSNPIVPWAVLQDIEVGEYSATVSLYRYNRETDEPELVATGQGDFVHVLDDSAVTVEINRTVPIPAIETGIGGMFQALDRDVYEIELGPEETSLTVSNVDTRLYAQVVAGDLDTEGYLVGTFLQKVTNGGSDNYVLRIDPYHGDFDILFDAEQRLMALAVNADNDVFALSWYDTWLALQGEEVTQTLYHYTMDGTLVSKVDLDRLIRGIDFAPDGRLIGVIDGNIYTISIDTGETSLLYAPDFGGGSDIDISSDGILRKLYNPPFPVVTNCNSCLLWSAVDLENGEVLHSVLYDDQPIELIDTFLIHR